VQYNTLQVTLRVRNYNILSVISILLLKVTAQHSNSNGTCFSNDISVMKKWAWNWFLSTFIGSPTMAFPRFSNTCVRLLPPVIMMLVEPDFNP